MGGRQGQRTVVLKVNPWASSRKGLVAVEHVTFLTSEDEIQRLQSGNYTPEGHFRVQNSEEDSSELVIHSMVTQVLKTTQPLIVGRSEDDFTHLISGKIKRFVKARLSLAGNLVKSIFL